MSFSNDFRASLSPDTAKRRLVHFRARLAAHGAASDDREIAGLKDEWQGVHYTYGALLRAQVDFAEAQLAEKAKLEEAADEPEAAPAETSQSTEARARAQALELAIAARPMVVGDFDLATAEMRADELLTIARRFADFTGERQHG